MERFIPVHISGVRHLIEIALSSSHRPPPRFTFISSVGAVMGHSSKNQVPSTPFNDPSVASVRGYGQAKYVAERIVDIASSAGLPCTVIRAGQLSACTPCGIWSETEFIPILLKSSQELGVIPIDMPVSLTLAGVDRLSLIHMRTGRTLAPDGYCS